MCWHMHKGMDSKAKQGNGRLQKLPQCAMLGRVMKGQLGNDTVIECLSVFESVRAGYLRLHMFASSDLRKTG